MIQTQSAAQLASPSASQYTPERALDPDVLSPSSAPTPSPFQGPLPVGMTPLVADRETRLKPAQIFVKIEGFELGGHLTDRLVFPMLKALLSNPEANNAPRELVLPALNRFAVSVAVQTAARAPSTKITIFYESNTEALRLRQLVTHTSVKLKRGSAADAATYAASLPSAHLLTFPETAPEAGAQLAAELLEQLAHTPPTHVILPSEGAPLSAALSAALRLPTASVLTLDAPPTPGPETERLSPIFHAFGRQGILLSPEGAAVLTIARDLAASLPSGTIIAVLPDGGSRHFGWAPGW